MKAAEGGQRIFRAPQASDIPSFTFQDGSGFGPRRFSIGER